MLQNDPKITILWKTEIKQKCNVPKMHHSEKALILSYISTAALTAAIAIIIAIKLAPHDPHDSHAWV